MPNEFQDKYVELIPGDLCPVTAQEAKLDKCIRESNFDGNTGTRRCVFFSHVIVGAFCCKHPDLTQTGGAE